MFEHIYRDTLIIQNKGKASMKTRLVVAKELKDYLEVVPVVGFCQARSQTQSQSELNLSLEAC